MKNRSRHSLFLWIQFNIVLFSAYLAFDVISFCWPNTVANPWIILFYLLTILVTAFIVYGLAQRIAGTNYLVVFVSLLMVAHLFIFIVSPLGMEIAYIGPSRAFYSLFISSMAGLMHEHHISDAVFAFNSTMVAVHGINVVCFTRRTAVDMFNRRMFNGPLKEHTV